MCEILEFIRRWRHQDEWLNGNCYWFAHILNVRFPFLKIYYCPIEGHFVAGEGEKFYDCRGRIFLNEKPILLEEIKEKDSLWYQRLLRDCVF